MGPNAFLAVEHAVVLEPDREIARELRWPHLSHTSARTPGLTGDVRLPLDEWRRFARLLP